MFSGRASHFNEMMQAPGAHAGGSRVGKTCEPGHASSPVMMCVCKCLQVQLMQREAELAEASSNAAAGSKAWKLEQARLQEAADKWRGQAVSLQAEVRALLGTTLRGRGVTADVCMVICGSGAAAGCYEQLPVACFECRACQLAPSHGATAFTASHDSQCCCVWVLAQLEAKHNDAVAASKAHSQEMFKLQVSLHPGQSGIDRPHELWH